MPKEGKITTIEPDQRLIWEDKLKETLLKPRQETSWSVIQSQKTSAGDHLMGVAGYPEKRKN